ncbi:hypothetical protein TNCV_1650071 [Trichonephila clavipes]|nr:hypothetical protein TNCV_1650071 [Trichonephila clavipes]
MNKSVREGDAPPFFRKLRSTCRGDEFFKLHSACVEYCVRKPIVPKENEFRGIHLRSPTPSPMERNYRRFSSGLHGSTAADSVRSEWPLWHAAKARQSSRAGAAKTRTKTFELVEEKQKLLGIREKRRTRGRCASRRYSSEYHRQTYL